MHRQMSHPVRVRGLKHVCKTHVVRVPESHPVRVRGLKLKETKKLEKCKGRTPCGCVD